ncbi:uncharacterized protein LOC115622905 [Scaptodrosophila lebanonensis]|uniref:Uncharacterized protein LOC115622905 n=1 Tax=Drosophila lebanonensis TaxID=7225 RepID=A0A6J2TCN7_DROLE|nr:uncharacterized protein LOC115622905 [Scaptodrosophila lebanonensis]
MRHHKLRVTAMVLLLVCRACTAHPTGNDIDDSNYQGTGGGNRPVDYHTVVGHFKDFFMYLPVMMTTLKETMSGFPKFAEGIRILASGKGRVDGEDCKCSKNSIAASNEVENSSRYG